MGATRDQANDLAAAARIVAALAAAMDEQGWPRTDDVRWVLDGLNDPEETSAPSLAAALLAAARREVPAAISVDQLNVLRAEIAVEMGGRERALMTRLDELELLIGEVLDSPRDAHRTSVRNEHVDALRAAAATPLPEDVRRDVPPAVDNVGPEVECPACGATIRARLADQPGAL